MPDQRSSRRPLVRDRSAHIDVEDPRRAHEDESGPYRAACRDDAQRYSFGVSKLSSDEARRIGKAIARIPEFLMPRQGFHPRGGGPRWRADRPYHVALEDRYIREHWDEIDALCKLNSLPFNATGEVIESGSVWRVYEFTWQMDAILFWARFEGRWLRGTEFHYPERPENLPSLKPLENWPKFNPRNLR
jgi:hypothetical protein